MITTRDIKVCIFSIFITTLCLALFNNNPIKEAEAQGGGVPLTHEEGAHMAHDNIYDLLQAHIKGAIANHTLTQDRLEDHIKGAIANHTLTQDRIEAHINGAVAKHAEMLEKTRCTACALNKRVT